MRSAITDEEILSAFEACKGDARKAAEELRTTYGCLKKTLTVRGLGARVNEVRDRWRRRYRLPSLP